MPARPAHMRRAMRLRDRRIVILAVAFVVIAIAPACGIRAGNVVLIPNGFRGWVVIRYNVSGAAELGHDGVKTLISVPESGAVFTSSDRPSGYARDEYYFVGGNDKRLRITSDAEGCQTRKPCVQGFEYITSPVKVTVFFVGTKQELPLYPRPNV